MNNIPKVISIKIDKIDIFRGLEFLTLSDILLPKGFKANQQFMIRFSPGAKGGNHKHSRMEVFISLDPLSLIWLDTKNTKHKIQMGLDSKERIKAIIMYPNIPHVVINKEKTKATLIEFASEDLINPEVVTII
jgi:quercetin dioxygenase-like cupin family protein